MKELTTDIHYDLNETVYQFEFSYSGQETAVQKAYLSSDSILNTLKYGRIEGLKVKAPKRQNGKKKSVLEDLREKQAKIAGAEPHKGPGKRKTKEME